MEFEEHFCHHSPNFPSLLKTKTKSKRLLIATYVRQISCENKERFQFKLHFQRNQFILFISLVFFGDTELIGIPDRKITTTTTTKSLHE